MALTPRLEIRQTQSLTLTPQLMQSIKLLQLSHLELQGFVEEQLLSNPLLEHDEQQGEPVEAGDAANSASENQNIAVSKNIEQQNLSQGDAPVPTNDEIALVPELVEAGEQMQSATQIAGEMDMEASDLYPEQVGQDSLAATSYQPTSLLGSSGDQSSDIAQYVAAKPTLADYLSEQICLLVEGPVARLIAHNLINNLDENGYLAIDCQTLSEQLGAEIALVKSVLSCVQKVEPAGIFARDLKECLALQLQEKDRLDPLMSALLNNLELVASHDHQKLLKLIGASTEDLKDMLAEIRDLDPRPGRAFDTSATQAIVADVFVREGPSGEWIIELNSEVLPKVLVNRTYYAQVTKGARGKKEKEFLVDCLQNANWLTKSLDQRAQTILKVTKEIVRMQDGFLVHGITSLRPMTLKNVADAIEMHESTVSRVTSNKYISTPRGLFEMKYFFTTALDSSQGEGSHSAESVRYLIKQMIENESLKSILSDDIIVKHLSQAHNIEVARRTIAKYREGMNIPSSVVRRRQKKIVQNAL